MKILVIQQKMIGDVLTSTIICEALKEKYPNATIDYLVNSSTLPVIKEHPNLGNVIHFLPEYRESRKAFYSFLKQIKNEQYDMVIDAYGKLESNIITYFSKAKEKISFKKWYTQFLYTKTIDRELDALTNASTAIENRLRLVFDEEEIVKRIKQPKIYLTKEEKENAKKYLESNGISNESPLIMISVLGSEKEKTLPFEKMAMVIDEVARGTKASILYNYIPSQEADAKKIYDLTNSQTQQQTYFNVFGKSLREFIAILSQCDALIGNEGGAVNMAKALDKPTFTIFSPWIVKKDWNMFEDGKKHMSVHLADHIPYIYTTQDRKELRALSLKFYTYFEPRFFIPSLQDFLNKNFKFAPPKKELVIDTKSKNKQKITAIIPTFNEAHNIKEVLESVTFADEIMVVDSYSTDATVEIAKQYTDFILQREFDYPASQKNWAIPQATHEWILLVDADERVTPELKTEIIKVLEEEPGKDNITGYWIKRRNHFMGKRVRFSGWQNDKVIRLFMRDHCRYEDKQVHEEIETDGRLVFLKNRFYHNTYTTLDAHMKKLNRYATWQANDYDKKTGMLTPYHFVLKPMWSFFKHYILQQGFRDGVVGFVIAYIQSYSVMMRYIKLWMLRHHKKTEQ